MTEEERREAERLANEKFPDSETYNHLGTREIWKDGYAAGREADAVDAKASQDYGASLVADLNAERARSGNLKIKLDQHILALKNERARSAELIENLNWLITDNEDRNKAWLMMDLRKAIAKYEAGK